MRHHAKCCADRSNRYQDIVILKLLGCWLPPSWISLDIEIVTDQTVTRAELRHRAKFRGDWSNRCHDILILDFSRCWLQSREWVTQSDP